MFVGCKKDNPVATDRSAQADYFPLAAGAQWVYSYSAKNYWTNYGNPPTQDSMMGVTTWSVTGVKDTNYTIRYAIDARFISSDNKITEQASFHMVMTRDNRVTVDLSTMPSGTRYLLFPDVGEMLDRSPLIRYQPDYTTPDRVAMGYYYPSVVIYKSLGVTELVYKAVGNSGTHTWGWTLVSYKAANQQ